MLLLAWNCLPAGWKELQCETSIWSPAKLEEEYERIIRVMKYHGEASQETPKRILKKESQKTLIFSKLTDITTWLAWSKLMSIRFSGNWIRWVIQNNIEWDTNRLTCNTNLLVEWIVVVHQSNLTNKKMQLLHNNFGDFNLIKLLLFACCLFVKFGQRYYLANLFQRRFPQVEIKHRCPFFAWWSKVGSLDNGRGQGHLLFGSTKRSHLFHYLE